MNPYLRGMYPPQGSGGGWMPPPGAYFGRAGTGVWSPAPGAYFGRGCPPAPAHAYNGCPPQAGRAAELAAMLRHPMGQWPGMPPLNAQAIQDAAACVVCNSQKHADELQIVYGVDSGAAPLIAIGGVATITVSPQKRHIPEKLVMSEAMAAAFNITGIFAGVEPVLATTGPISSAIFVQDSTIKAFKSVIADVGLDFSVAVANISGVAARFTTSVVGKPVPPGL